MEQLEFKTKMMNKNFKHLTDEERDMYCREFCGNTEFNDAVLVAMEELSELSQVISKWARYGVLDHYHFLEETADVMLCLNSLSFLAQVSREEQERAYDIKAKRTHAAIARKLEERKHQKGH